MAVSSGSLAMFAAIRRASSLLSNLAADSPGLAPFRNKSNRAPARCDRDWLRAIRRNTRRVCFFGNGSKRLGV